MANAIERPSRFALLRAISLMAVVMATFATAGRAGAQAPINSNAALQPPRHGLILRQQFRYARADFNRKDANLDIALATESTTAVFGVTNAFTLLLNAPVVLSRRIENNAVGASDTEAGLADWTALVKVRLYRSDTSPTDTLRVDGVAGLELPTGAAAFTSNSVDPIVGAVFTMTRGRHFFDADFLWKFNTGTGLPDRMRYDAAYIYRLWPARHTGSNPAAFNALIELNGAYETNGDNEIFVSPGVQYVTTRWILEATVQLPAWRDLDHRAETDFIVGVGVRVQF